MIVPGTKPVTLPIVPVNVPANVDMTPFSQTFQPRYTNAKRTRLSALSLYGQLGEVQDDKITVLYFDHAGLRYSTYNTHTGEVKRYVRSLQATRAMIREGL